MNQAKTNGEIAHAQLNLRRPLLADGKAVHDLVRRCPPLDLNSSYSYFLLCSHFVDTCVVAEREGTIVGFISAYRLPQDSTRLFVWQVAVDSSARGLGLAGRMLESLLDRSVCDGVRYLETTVSPSNKASRQVFARFAAKRGLDWHEEQFLSRDHFGAETHEEEVLFRLGPLNRKQEENP